MGRSQTETITIRVTPEEKSTMQGKMYEAIAPSMRDFILKMCMNGKVIVNSDLRELNKELRYQGNNLNQLHSGVDITDPYRWSSTTIRSILRNQDYIGNTVNCKTKVKSFKVKKQLRLPKEEWLIFENTHEALISKSDFETVQLILDGRNRPDKSGLSLIHISEPTRH